MSTLLSFAKDITGQNTFAPAFPTDIFSATLAASTVKTITVPSNYSKWLAVFNGDPGMRIWVSVNKTAALPAGASFASGTSIPNPPALLVNAADVISIITPDASTNVGVYFYAIS